MKSLDNRSLSIMPCFYAFPKFSKEYFGHFAKELGYLLIAFIPDCTLPCNKSIIKLCIRLFKIH